jgi:peptide/nickel transport system permease protein
MIPLSLDRKELLLKLKIIRRDPLSLAGGIIVALFYGTALVVTVFGTAVTPYNPDQINLNVALQPPSLIHLLGTDELGRDILSRIIIAAPIDAAMATAIVGTAILIGMIVGSLAGYFGGRVDEVLMRLTDLFLAIPTLVLAISVSVALGPGVVHVMEATAISWWPIYARLSRSGAMLIRESQYVEAAQVAGLSHLSILARHIVPNTISTVITYATLDLGGAILYASVLSYLGLGAQPPQAEWGRMVFDGQTFLASAWWVPLAPGLVILVVALGFNLLGDSIRDILDPRYRR